MVSFFFYAYQNNNSEMIRILIGYANNNNIILNINKHDNDG